MAHMAAVVGTVTNKKRGQKTRKGFENVRDKKSVRPISRSATRSKESGHNLLKKKKRKSIQLQEKQNQNQNGISRKVSRDLITPHEPNESESRRRFTRCIVGIVVAAQRCWTCSLVW